MERSKYVAGIPNATGSWSHSRRMIDYWLRKGKIRSEKEANLFHEVGMIPTRLREMLLNQHKVAPGVGHRLSRIG